MNHFLDILIAKLCSYCQLSELNQQPILWSCRFSLFELSSARLISEEFKKEHYPAPKKKAFSYTGRISQERPSTSLLTKKPSTSLQFLALAGSREYSLQFIFVYYFFFFNHRHQFLFLCSFLSYTIGKQIKVFDVARVSPNHSADFSLNQFKDNILV